MALKKGTRAPKFALKSTSKLKDVAIKFNTSKQTVLLFFPLAFTGACTKEFCTLTAGMNDYKKLKADVYGISVDSPFAQEAWAKQEKIKITLLSDFNKKVSQAYGVLQKTLLGLQGVAKRSAFVVSKDGKITYSWVSNDPLKLPDFKAIKAVLEQKEDKSTKKTPIKKKRSASKVTTKRKTSVVKSVAKKKRSAVRRRS